MKNSNNPFKNLKNDIKKGIEQAKNEKTSIKDVIGGVVIIAIAIFAFKSCSSGDSPQFSQVEEKPPVTQSQQQTDPKTKIGEYAIEVMKKKDYPKAFQKFGEKYINKVNQLAPSIALKAANDPTCDYVEVVTFSTTNSTSEDAFWIVDCKNKMRLHFTERM